MWHTFSIVISHQVTPDKSSLPGLRCQLPLVPYHSLSQGHWLNVGAEIPFLPSPLNGPTFSHILAALPPQPECHSPSPSFLPCLLPWLCSPSTILTLRPTATAPGPATDTCAQRATQGMPASLSTFIPTNSRQAPRLPSNAPLPLWALCDFTHYSLDLSDCHHTSHPIPLHQKGSRQPGSPTYPG